jgi:hypothetical protein
MTLTLPFTDSSASNFAAKVVLPAPAGPSIAKRVTPTLQSDYSNDGKHCV